MVYTSHFGMVKKLTKSGHPYELIAVCREVPSWFKGRSYLDVAPDWELIREKKTKDPAHWSVLYKERVLNALDPAAVYNTIQSSAEGRDVVLLTSDPEDVHRQTLREWFTNASLSCVEWSVRGD